MALRLWLASMVTVLLAVILQGQIKALQYDLPYPVDGQMLIQEVGDGARDLAELADLAEQEGNVFYKEYIDDQGHTQVLRIGLDAIDDSLNLPIKGLYYVKRIPHDLVKQLNHSGFKVQVQAFDVFLLPQSVFVEGARAYSLWLLIGGFGLMVYGIELIYMKVAMVHRHIGRLMAYFGRVFGQYSLAMSMSFGLMWCVYSGSHGHLLSIYNRSFAVSLAIGYCLMTIILVLFLGLAVGTGRAMAIVNLLKAKYVSRWASLVYLLLILLANLGFAMAIKATWTSSQALRGYERTLSYWEHAKGYVSMRLDDEASAHTLNHQIDHDWLVKQTNFEVKQLQELKAEDLIISMPSSFNADMARDYREFFPQSPLQIDSRLSSAMRYVSEGFILKNKQLYPRNHYPNSKNDQLFTVFLPAHLQGAKAQIQGNLLAEHFAYDLPATAIIEWIIVPSGQKSFLFSQAQDMAQDGLFTAQEAEDAILVQVNVQHFQLGDDVLKTGGLMLSNYREASYINRKSLKAAFDLPALKHQLKGVVDISQNAQIARKRVASQIQGSVYALIGLMGASLFYFYHYLNQQYKRFAKTLSVVRLYGNSYIRQVFSLLAPLIGSLLGLTYLIYQTTGDWQLSLVVGMSDMLLALVVVIGLEIRQDRQLSSVLKDGEI